MTDVQRQAGWLARRLAEQDRRLSIVESRKPGLAQSSIEDGAIEEYTVDGTFASSVGKQPDGSHVAFPATGPVPAAPVAPTLKASPGLVEIRWSGKFDDGAVSSLDFKHVGVYVSTTPEVDTTPSAQAATIRGELGDVVSISAAEGTLYVCLVAWTAAGKASAPSPVTAIAVPAIADADAIGTELADLNIKYDDVLAEAGQLDGRLDTAETDITASKDRLTTAEGKLTDAFGQLGTVDTRIDTAKTATLTAAAATAQTKADAALAAANAQVAQVVARGMSLVRNGDFEAPDGWALGTGIVIVSTSARSGAKSLQIGPNPGGNLWPVSEWVPGATGRTYYLEAWFKRTGTEVKALGVGFVVQSKTAAGGTATPTVGKVDSATISTTAWTKVTATYTVPTADAVSVRFAPWIAAGNNVYNVDDILVVDVTEAQAALNTANDASAAAAAAQTAAGSAKTTADNALTMATSKSTVFYSTSVATGTGTAAGDLWRQRDGNNAIIGEWQWSGTAWVKQTVSGSNVSNMDIGYLTAGAATMSQALIDKLVAGTANFQTVDVKNLFATAATLDSAVVTKLWAEVVNSQKITTKMLAVGAFDNVIPDPSFANGGGDWGTTAAPYSFPQTEGYNGTPAFKIAPNTAQAGRYSASVPIVGGAAYRVTVWVKSDVAIPAGQLGIYSRSTKAGGAVVAVNQLKQTGGAVGNDAIPANTWTQLSAALTFDPAAVSGMFGFYKQTTFTTGTVWYSMASATRMAGGSLVVDGVVDGQTIRGVTVIGSEVKTSDVAGTVVSRMGPQSVWDPLGGVTRAGIGFSKIGTNDAYPAGMYSTDGANLYLQPSNAGGAGGAYVRLGAVNGQDIYYYSYSTQEIAARGGLILGSTVGEVAINGARGITLNGVPTATDSHWTASSTQANVPSGQYWGPGTPAYNAADTSDTGMITWGAADTIKFRDAGIYAVSVGVRFTAAMGSGGAPLPFVSVEPTTSTSSSIAYAKGPIQAGDSQGTASVPNIKVTAGQQMKIVVFQNSGAPQTAYWRINVTRVG